MIESRQKLSGQETAPFFECVLCDLTFQAVGAAWSADISHDVRCPECGGPSLGCRSGMMCPDHSRFADGCAFCARTKTVRHTLMLVRGIKADVQSATIKISSGEEERGLSKLAAAVMNLNQLEEYWGGR